MSRYGQVLAACALCFSAGSALPVGQVLPAQASPGALVDVQVTTANYRCAGDGQPSQLVVRIGSVRATDVRCATARQEGISERRVLTFTVPKTAAPGPQSLTVLEASEPPPGQRGEVNFEVLPPQVEYLVVKKGFEPPQLDFTEVLRNFDPNTILLSDVLRKNYSPLLDKLRRSVPANFSLPRIPLPRRASVQKTAGINYIPPIPLNFQQNSTSARADPPLAEEVRYNTETFISPTLGYQNEICGRTLYGLKKKNIQELRPILGLLLQAQAERRKVSEDYVLIAPDTVGRPPGTTVQSSGQFATEAERLKDTETGLKSIRAFLADGEKIKRNPGAYGDAAYGDFGWGGKAHVFVIDTLSESGEDAAGLSEVEISGQNLVTRGHGEWIKYLITDESRGIAPRAEISELNACGPESCKLYEVIDALCQAGRLSADERKKAEGKRVIVNASFATPYNNILLKAAIRDAVHAGVAVVTAFGNNDRCPANNEQEDFYTLSDYCNAYPADWIQELDGRSTIGALYSVGASQQGNEQVQNFQRGQESYGDGGNRKIRPRATLTQPSTLAPSFFWFRDPQELTPAEKSRYPDAVRQGNVRPYKGTSFSAPLLVGALALWSSLENNKNCEKWPSLTDMLKLDIPDLLARACPS